MAVSYLLTADNDVCFPQLDGSTIAGDDVCRTTTGVNTGTSFQ